MPEKINTITITVTCPSCQTQTAMAAYQNDLLWDTCDGCGRTLNVTVMNGQIERVE